MGSERGLDDKLAGNIALEQTKLLELCKTLSFANRLVSHIKSLIADIKLNSPVRKLNQLCIRHHL